MSPANDSTLQDHPRTRGEQVLIRAMPDCIAGSPPHTRGAGIVLVRDILTFGITPAHAGSSQYANHKDHNLKDHPRTRGEQVAAACSCAIFAGSPPHTRGAEEEFLDWTKPIGITPAHAGSS